MGSDGLGRRLSRQRAEILIVLGLALLGGVCGWLLRDQFVKRDEMRESDDLRSSLGTDRLPVRDPPVRIAPPLPEADGAAADIDRPGVAAGPASS